MRRMYKNIQKDCRVKGVIMEDKKTFVRDLGNLISKHCPVIEDMEYLRPGIDYNEEIKVTYRGGHTQTINVSMDSVPAMLRDIARHLEI